MQVTVNFFSFLRYRRTWYTCYLMYVHPFFLIDTAGVDNISLVTL